MEFDFETRVNRKKMGNIKNDWFTPNHITDAGLVSYSGAEFEFKTAKPVIDAVVAAAENGLFGFTYADENYLSHIVWWVQKVRHIPIEPEWILPVQGTIFSVATTIRMLVNEGEAILIPTPNYNRYKQAADRLGRTTYLSSMKEENGRFIFDFENLERQMARPETRLLVFSNPNNPTGTITGREDLERVLELAGTYQVAVLQDEIFADVTLSHREVPMLAQMAGEEDQVLSVISMGKTFSFTGVNNAIAIIKNPQLRERYKLQRDADHFGSIDPMAYAALCGGYSPEGVRWLEELRTVIRRNNDRLKRFFEEAIPGSRVVEPEAGYTLWVDLSPLSGDPEELKRFLEDEAYFCCDPGEEYYGEESFVRICTAVPAADLEKSICVFQRALEKRKKK